MRVRAREKAAHFLQAALPSPTGGAGAGADGPTAAPVPPLSLPAAAAAPLPPPHARARGARARRGPSRNPPSSTHTPRRRARALLSPSSSPLYPPNESPRCARAPSPSPPPPPPTERAPQARVRALWRAWGPRAASLARGTFTVDTNNRVYLSHQYTLHNSRFAPGGVRVDAGRARASFSGPIYG